MTGKTNAKRAAGAASGEKYYIATTYPAGSTCTCTNGVNTYTAEDTSGTYIFTVPSIGEWTVTSSNGSFTKSKTITISNIYNVTIIYAYDWNAQGTEGWAIGNKCENTQSYVVSNVVMTETQEGYVYIDSTIPTGWAQGTVYLADPIDFTGFSTLDLYCTYKATARFHMLASIWSSEPNDGTPMATNRVAVEDYYPANANEHNLELHLDVTNVTGLCYFGLDLETSGGGHIYPTVKRIHIE